LADSTAHQAAANIRVNGSEHTQGAWTIHPGHSNIHKHGRYRFLVGLEDFNGFNSIASRPGLETIQAQALLQEAEHGQLIIDNQYSCNGFWGGKVLRSYHLPWQHVGSFQSQ
jgi:hypothetical protein